ERDQRGGRAQGPHATRSIPKKHVLEALGQDCETASVAPGASVELEGETVSHADLIEAQGAQRIRQLEDRAGHARQRAHDRDGRALADALETRLTTRRRCT